MGSAIDAVRQLEHENDELRQKYAIATNHDDRAGLVDENVRLRDFVAQVESLAMIYGGDWSINPSCHNHIELCGHLNEALTKVKDL